MARGGGTYRFRNFAYDLAYHLLDADQYSVLNYSPPNSNIEHDVFISSYPRTAINLMVAANFASVEKLVSAIRNTIDENLTDKSFDLGFFVINDEEQNFPEEELKESLEGISEQWISFIHEAQTTVEAAEKVTSNIFHTRKTKVSPRKIPLHQCDVIQGHTPPALPPMTRPEELEERLSVSFNLENQRYRVLEGEKYLQEAKEKGDKEISARVISCILPPRWKIELSKPKPPKSRYRTQTRTPAFAHTAMHSMMHTTPTYGTPEEADDRPHSLVDAIGPELDGLISTIYGKADISKVLLFEYDMLKKEYEEHHFTSCGLRVGRLLESVIFSMGKNWGVELEKPKIDKLVRMNDKLKEIESYYIQYLASEDSRKANLKQNLIKSIRELNDFNFDLTTSASADKLDEDLSKKDFKLARTVLQDIRKKYLNIGGVIDEFGRKNELIKTYNDIHGIRNQAAHADIQLKPRELEKSDVDEMLETIRVMMKKLTNIGVSIIEHSSAD